MSALAVSAGPALKTARLLLRPPLREDFDAYAELVADAEATRFIGGQLPRAAAWRRFLQMPGAWAVQGFGMFSLIERASGEWVGQLGPWQPEGWPGTEVGWALHRRAWGRGFATEAAEAAIDWAFATLGWSEVIHCIDDGNIASQRLARRLGSSVLRRSKLPPPYETSVVDVWGQSRAQWQARRVAGAPC
ncbi:MAG TPA: GNAT family N-acetyltransferase [Luteimonas sp.]|nr:GNAT family N-acetyltransferase [Luteimonas sp.]